MSTERRRVGRPPRAGVPATSKLMIRVTDAELDAIRAAAFMRGVDVSTFVRGIALRAAKRTLQQ